MENIIEVSHLKKKYGDLEAVKDVSFVVRKGQLFAFLGPNGAGKSTTIDTLCTLNRFDEGSVYISGNELGKEDEKIHNLIGVVFQEGVLDPVLSVRRNLEIRGSFYHLSGKVLEDAIKRVSNITNISDILDQKYGTLSGGQKRRCDIARALIHTPKILFLDEPTTGLDPQTRKNVWDTIIELNKETELTIFLTTHYMEEVQYADYAVIIDHGEIVAKGTPMQLKDEYACDLLRLECIDCEEVENNLRERYIEFSRKEKYITVKLDTTMDAKPILDLCEKNISGFEVTRGNMDDVFLNITGKELRE